MQKVFKYIKRYTRLYIAVLRRSMSRNYTYRLEVISRLFRAILIVLIQILILSVIYSQDSNFVGWNESEAYLLTGTFNVLNYLAWSVFLVNLGRLEERISKGECDLLLLMPMSSIFSISLTDFFTYDFSSVLVGMLLIGYYIITSFGSYTIINVLLYILMFIIAFFIMFNIYIFISSFTFVKSKNGLISLTKEVIGISKFPIDIWSSNIQFVFYTFLPIAFITQIPSKILMGEYSIYTVLAGIAVLVVTTLISRYVWNMNVKKYISFGG